MFALLALIAAQDRVAPPPDCSQSTGVGYGVGYQPSVPRQGETVTLTAMVVRGYGMPPEPADPKCVEDWKVEGEGVKLLNGGKLRISAKAVPGTEIRFSAHVGGIRGQRGYGSLKIIGANEQVLSGTFHIAERGPAERGICIGNVAEIGFSARGGYTYTRPEDMFETKVTGSGSYKWDAASGRLELFDDDGRLYQRGTARWVDGRLVLDDIDPGGPMSPDDPSLGLHCHLVLTGG